MKHKRRFAFFIAVILAAFFICGCGGKEIKSRIPTEGFSAHFLDVGQGDCIFVRFSDGKTMLVDCGEQDQNLSEFIVGFLKDGKIDKIDYFVLTHPDSDHVGNAVDIINNFEIGTVFIPDIYQGHLGLLPVYKNALVLIEEKGISVNTSDAFDVIVGEDYGVAFLSPMPSALNDSSYNDFNASAAPTATQVNALSPIIYLEVQGVRFLLTGDAPISQEKLALEWSKVGNAHYQNYGLNVNLNNIDFLKVGHHGASDSSGEEFLQSVIPQNAIISVYGDNYYAHPSSDVLDRLVEVNPLINLWRTDVHGTISVCVDGFGKYKIITDADFE